MDKALIRQRFAKATDSYDRQAGMQKHVARHMAEAIKSHIPDSDGWNVLEIGCGTGLFTREYLRGLRPGRLLLNDICPEIEPYLSGLPTASPIRFQACDAETLRFPAGQHLIVSCSAVQWFERPERFLSGCRELLTTGGYLAFSTFGPQNVREVASLTSETLPYRSLEELRRTLSGVYQIVYSREEILHFTFPSPLDVLKHLQATGVTGLRSRKWTKGQLEDFCQRYHRLYAAQDGTVPLTYHPIYMICKKQGK